MDRKERLEAMQQELKQSEDSSDSDNYIANQ
jgi:hypothetical protein